MAASSWSSDARNGQRETRELVRFGLLLTLAIVICGAALAQTYPSRSVRLVVPYAAGGPADIVARVTSAKPAQALPELPTIAASGLAGYESVP